MKFGQWFYQNMMCHHKDGDALVMYKNDLTSGRVVICMRCSLTMPLPDNVWRKWEEYEKSR